jgi:hypothetical protein
MAALGRRWWPLVLVGLGVVNLIRLSDRGWALVGPLLAIGAGIILLMLILEKVDRVLYPRLWPAALALVGGALVLAATLPAENDLCRRGDLRRMVWFRGELLESTASSFWYARITVLAGALTLDLRRAVLHERTIVHVNALFGTVDLLLEPGTTVMVRRPFVFGMRGPVGGDKPPEEIPQVTVSVLAIFGDARIRRSLGTTPLVSSTG